MPNVAPVPPRTLPVPLALARTIEWILSLAETLPIAGLDATKARRALRALAPEAFTAAHEAGVPICEVCRRPIPPARILNGASRGHVARFDTDRCRDTARKRRIRKDPRP